MSVAVDECRYGVAPVMYRYAEVEAALAKLLDVDPECMGAFRGRIIHIRRLGIGPVAEKKGKAIDYSYEDVAVWAFCLQFAEYGLDPSGMQAFLDSTWSFTLPLLREADDDEEDTIFYFLPNAMTRAFVNGIGPRARIACGLIPMSKATIATMGERLHAPQVGVTDVSRIATINLSQLRRSLIAALSLFVSPS